MPNHHKHLSSLRIHRGQAMIEYAILLLLLVMIFVGGAEIGSTALASYKNTDAAKSAISEFAEMNQQRLNIVNAEKQYLLTLRSYGDCGRVTELGGCDPAGLFSTYVEFLDGVYEDDSRVDSSIGDGVDGLEQVFGALVEAHITCPTLSGTSVDWDTDDNCEITEAELLASSLDYNSGGASNVDNDDRTRNGQKKFRALLALQHNKLASLPLDITNSVLSESRLRLADHGAISATALCNTDGTYEYNLPNRYIYKKYQDEDGNELVYQTGNDVYLFQSISINVQSCEGVDANRGNQSRLSILVNGYTKPSAEISTTDPEGDFLNTTDGFVEGLPKLNQAMYGLYTKVCVNQANEYVSCNAADVDRVLLKPPGKLCFAEGGLNEDNCPNSPNADETSGFYMWGRSSASKDGYEIDNVANELATGFRPTYQLDCSPQPNLKAEVDGEFGDIHDTACDSNPSKVRVHTRYRKVFEGFVTLGLMELASTANGELGLFYNPNNVGVTNQVNSVAGSEIGPLGANQRPTVKYFRDFRGCYEVDVETNQVSACN